MLFETKVQIKFRKCLKYETRSNLCAKKEFNIYFCLSQKNLDKRPDVLKKHDFYIKCNIYLIIDIIK